MPKGYSTLPSDDVEARGAGDAAHQSYTQAPPLYDPHRPNIDADEEFGKFGPSVAESSVDVRHLFVRKVYTILFCQLLLTTVAASVLLYVDSVRSWIQSNTWMMWISMLGTFLFMGLTFWKSRSYPSNLLFLSGFTLFEAYTIGVVTSFYEQSVVIQALILTLVVFAGLTLFSFQTKYDFTTYAPYLFSALWLLIGFGFIAMFFPASSKMDLLYSGAATAIFSAYIVIDTQMVFKHFHYEEEIAASMSLYLDVINLFLNLLHLLNSRSDN